jgi:hypothetical protein
MRFWSLHIFRGNRVCSRMNIQCINKVRTVQSLWGWRGRFMSRRSAAALKFRQPTVPAPFAVMGFTQASSERWERSSGHSWVGSLHCSVASEADFARLSGTFPNLAGSDCAHQVDRLTIGNWAARRAAPHPGQQR